MTPVIPYSTTNISVIPETAFIVKPNYCLTRCSLLRKSAKHTLSSQRLLLPLSTSLRLFPQCTKEYALFHRSVYKVSATGTDVAVEEPDSSVVGEASGGTSEVPADAGETSGETPIKSDVTPGPAQSKRSRPGRKSEMPPVKNEELVPGATFIGKVRSIQPFGAFVDFGAFTDGLVHVSRLSDSFVKDVGNIVSVGQEVKVRLIEANIERERISLSMRESDDNSKPQQQKDASPTTSSDKPRPARKKKTQKKEDVKSSKFVKGQDLEGTVKKMTRAGAFISLPEGEEGFLPIAEETDDGFGNVMGTSSLQLGQEVSVRVLRISRGQVTLTMKKEEDNEKLDLELELSQGIVQSATNPFVLAFRKNKDIAAFLDEREKAQKAVKEPAMLKTSKKIGGPIKETETTTDVPEVQDQPGSNDEGLVGVPPILDETVEADETSVKDVSMEASDASDMEPQIVDSSSSQSVDGAVQNIEKEEESSEILDAEGGLSIEDQIIEEAPSTDGIKSEEKSGSSVEMASQIISSETLVGDASDMEPQIEESSLSLSQSVDGAVQTIKKEEESSEILDAEGGLSIEDQTEEASSTDVIKSEEKSESSVEIASQLISSETLIGEKVEESKPDYAIAKDEAKMQNPIVENEVSSTATIEDEGVRATTDKNGSVTVQPDIPSPKEAKDGVETVENSTPSGETGKVQIPSPESKAIEEVGENQVESAKDKVQIEAPVSGIESGTSAQVEGAKDEVQFEAPVAETVSGTSSQVESAKDEVQIEAPVAETETATASQVEDKRAQLAPEKNGISDGVASVENSDLSVEENGAQITSSETEAVKEVVEDQVESTSDEVQIEAPAADIEVATALKIEDEKVEPTFAKNGIADNSNGQSASPSPKESMTKVMISPALVKQLREETGAGMMDCKNALAETGGDIIKAQEFLRKKGLASAEKKASRATAEGRIGSYIHDGRIGVLIEVNCETDFVSRGEIFKELVDDLAMQVAACPQVEYLLTEDVPEEIVNKEKEIEMQKEDLLSKPEQIRAKIVEGRIRKRLDELVLLEQPYIKNDKVVVKDWIKQTIATIGENMKVKRFVRFNLGEGLEKKSQDFAAEVAAQTAATTKPVEAPAKEQPAVAEAKETSQKPVGVAVSAAIVKQLREETGAGMMDCKKALSETGGDLEKAQEYLRKKGLSTADKKSSRLAAEGRIGSYIHDSRIGVLMEVNCETDFVGRSEKFKELVDDLAMQVVACPQVQFVSIEEIPESIVNKEKDLERQREDLLSKPENIREKIVDGRVSKRLGELALLEQPFIRDDSLLVKDLVKQTVAALGENIKVRRFVKFTLGETTEDEKTETES